MSIEFSQRLKALPGYPLAEIPALKRRLIERGVDVIDLGAGDNDTPPPAVDEFPVTIDRSSDVAQSASIASSA